MLWSASGGTTMVNEETITIAAASPARLSIRTIGPADLMDVLAKGLDDFKAKPSHILLLVAIYPVIGLFAARIAAGYDVLPFVFPLVSGFALIGPLAAIGLYEMSRRREAGLDPTWQDAFEIFRSPALGSIMVHSFILGALYFAWLAAAQLIYWATFGSVMPVSIPEFARQVFTTPAGWTLIIVGCGVGFIFAAVVLAVSAFSFPLLLDRNVGALTAVQTSVRVSLANPVTMLLWGFIVAGLLAIGSVPLFVGLAVVMPVLGHATWHLYRKAVE
jgi:uncharacterized membrane protein